jgi:protein-histidine pros-kinase
MHPDVGSRTTRADVAALLGAAPDAMVVVDHRGVIVQANTRCERLLGYRTGELTGQPVDILVPTELRDLHRRYRSGYLADPTVREMGSGLELSAQCKDGSRTPVEISLSPIDSERGPLVLAAIRKASRSRNEDGLFRRFLEALPDAVVIVDESGQMILANVQVEEMFGYARSELLGRPVETLIPERFVGNHVTFRESYVASTPRPRPLSLAGGMFGKRRDGTEFPVEISLAPLDTDEGTLVMAHVRDVTDTMAITEAMREAEERRRIQEETTHAKDVFFATVSHELRTPLTSMMGFAELIADSGDLTPENEHFLSVILRNGRREIRLVDDLLTLVSLSEGRLTVNLGEVDLVATVRDVVESTLPQAEAARLAVHVELPDIGLPVACDVHRISQAIENLLSNAIKFTAAGGTVTVRLETVGSSAHIDVIDTGIGIGDAQPERLFERLYRSPTAVAHEIPGAGLGLSIAAAILEAHDGRIRLVRSDDSGSTFRIELPIER